MVAVAKKVLIYLATFAILGAAYSHIGVVTLERSSQLSLLTPLDEAIPFVPEMAFFYVSVHLFWLPAVLMPSFTPREFVRLAATMSIAFLLALAAHYYVPSAYPRPTLSANNPSLAVAILRFYYWLDFPNNTFPSTHCVVVTILLCTTRYRLRPRLRSCYEIWGALIFASTVLVKQHYVVDVAGGIILGTIVFALLNQTPRASHATQAH